MSDAPQTAPPVGEEIHLPDPSIIPLLNAIGLALAIVGAVAGVVLVIGGGALFLVTTVLWIRDARRELDSLPLDHHAAHTATAPGAAEGVGEGEKVVERNERAKADKAADDAPQADGEQPAAVSATKLEK